MQIAEEHNLMVLEDAAEGLGSEYKGKKCGSIGRRGRFFHFTEQKTLSTGEGGNVGYEQSANSRTSANLKRSRAKSER